MRFRAREAGACRRGGSSLQSLDHDMPPRRGIEGDYPAVVNFNTETELEYLPDMHAIVWVNVGEEDIRLIRLQ